MIVKRIRSKRLTDKEMGAYKPPMKEEKLKSDWKISNKYRSYVNEEVGEEVFKYFEELGVFQTNEVLILSSRHSFSYDESTLQKIRIIFNLKVLNKLPKINILFLKLNKLLPIDGYYIGCYDDIYSIQEKFKQYISPGFAKILIWLLYYFPRIILNLPIIDIISNAIGINYNQCLSIRDVQKIMKSNGFSVVITKRFNNKTFFIAKKHKNIKKRKLILLNILESFESNHMVINF
jgi:hypothetical protein